MTAHLAASDGAHQPPRHVTTHACRLHGERVEAASCATDSRDREAATPPRSLARAARGRGVDDHRRAPAWIAGVLACALLTTAACQPPPPATAARAAGFAEATEVRVAAEVGGTVLELAVDEGSRVERGQPIARLDTRATVLQMDRAQAELDQALAQVRLVEAPARIEDIASAEAQIAGIDAELKAFDTERTSAEADLARFESLLAAKAGTTKARDDAQLRVRLIDDRSSAARQRRAMAQAALDRLRAGARTQEIDVARTRIAAARAQIATLDKALNDATILAPMSGIVTRTLVEAGEIVAPRSPLLLIVDIAHAWATVYVEEPDIPRIVMGQAASITTDAPGQRLSGTVSYISPEAEFTPRNVQTADERAKQVYRVRIAVDNASGILKPGMPVLAELPYQQNANSQISHQPRSDRLFPPAAAHTDVGAPHEQRATDLRVAPRPRARQGAKATS